MMKPILNFWMQPVYARINLESKKSLFWVLAIALLLGQLLAAMIFVGGDKHGVEVFLYALMLSVAAISCIVLMAWFVMLTQYMGQQSSPANMGLVPQWKNYAKLAIALPILIVALIVALVFFVVEQRFSALPSFVCVSVMVFFAISVRSPWMTVFLIFSFQLPNMLERAGYQEELASLASSRLEVVLALLAGMIVMIVIGLHWLFSARGDTLFSMHKRSLAFQDGMSGRRTHESKMSLSFSVLYMRWMARSVDMQRIGEGLKSNLLVFSLSPRLHWTTIATQLFLIGIAGFAAIFILQSTLLKSSEDFLLGFGLGFGGLMMIFLPLLIAFILYFSVYQTRVEQGLLSLAPNLGNTKQRNLTYILYLLRQFLMLYFFSVLGAAVYIAFADLTAFKLAILVLLVACTFPLILNLCVRFSEMRSAQDHPLMKSLFLCGVLFLIGLSLIWLISPIVAWVYCPMVIAVTSFVLWRKLRINLNLDLFPAGRAV